MNTLDSDIWETSARDSQKNRVKAIIHKNTNRNKDILSLKNITTDKPNSIYNQSNSNKYLTSHKKYFYGGNLKNSATPNDNVGESCLSNDKNLSTMVDCIKNHLNRMNSADVDSTYNKNETFLVGDNSEINTECMIALFIGNSEFSNQSSNCIAMLKANNYINNDGNYDSLFDIIFKIRGNYNDDNNYNDSLYKFSLSLIAFIASDSFERFDENAQINLITHTREFVRRNIDYNIKFMEKYLIYNKKNSNINNNLLFLYHMLTMRQVNNTSNDIDNLKRIYTQLTNTITKNLELYNQINKNTFDKNSSTYNGSNIPGLKNIIDTLQQNLQQLDTNYTNLQNNLANIDANGNAVAANSITDSNIVTLAQQLYPKSANN